MVVTAQQQHTQRIGSNIAAYCAGADKVLLNLPLTPRMVENLLETQRCLKDLTSPQADLGVHLPGVTYDNSGKPHSYVQNIAGIAPLSTGHGRA